MCLWVGEWLRCSSVNDDRLLSLSQVVSHVNGVNEVTEEIVSQMNSLYLSS